MVRDRQAQAFGQREEVKGARNLGQMMYQRKFDAAFAHEMNRSVQAMLQAWGMEGRHENSDTHQNV